MSLTKLIAVTQLALGSKKGAAMVEYALLAALIAVVAVGALTTLGSNISSKLSSIAGSIGS